MKTRTLKLCIAFFCTAVVAFIAGHYCTFPPTSGRAAGDVGRAKVYSRSVVEVDADNLQERLQSDSSFCAATVLRAVQMQAQAHALASLIEESNELLADNDSLEASLEALNIPYQSVLNACDALDLYVDNLSKLSTGSRIKGFEQCYNNALLGYYLVSSKNQIVNAFSADLKKYMPEDEESDEVKTLSWKYVDYAVYSALMSGDQQLAKSIIIFNSDSGLQDQEKLDAFYRYIKDNEQLNIFFNQEQLGLVERTHDNEQLNIIRNQEQLGILRNIKDNEQLNLIRNQEQLGYFKKFKDNEQLGILRNIK